LTPILRDGYGPEGIRTLDLSVSLGHVRGAVPI